MAMDIFFLCRFFVFALSPSKLLLPLVMSTIVSAGLRTNEAPYLGPEGGRPGRPTLAVRHTCSGNLGIAKILRYIRSDIVKEILAGR